MSAVSPWNLQNLVDLRLHVDWASKLVSGDVEKSYDEHLVELSTDSTILGRRELVVYLLQRFLGSGVSMHQMFVAA